MKTERHFSEIACLVGDKVRSTLLWHLLDGRALTSTELSIVADVSPQSASNHLGLLVKGNLLTVEKQGRHRYYRFANDEVAHVIEAMASLAHTKPSTDKKIIEPAGITYVRTCYDHLAGKIAVDLTHTLVLRGMIKLKANQFSITEEGRKWFQSFEFDIEAMECNKRPLVRACLDWSERKFHLAGSLGAALLQHMLNHDWIRRKRNTREVLITGKGKKEIESRFRITIISSGLITL